MANTNLNAASSQRSRPTIGISVARAVLASGLVLILGAYSPIRAEDVAIEEGQKDQKLADSIRRYFRSSGSHEAGDLIVRSQVEELQNYLRKTRGPIPASNARILKRVLPDSSQLARLFYRQSGAYVLRTAASRLGGYHVLDRLCNTREGLTKIRLAIGSGKSEDLNAIASAEESPDGTVGLGASDPVDGAAHRYSKIYTVEDFLQAAGLPTNRTEIAKKTDME